MYYTDYSVTTSARDFMYKVYGWMAVALTITASTALYVFSTPALYGKIFTSPGLLIGLFIGQIGLVIALSSMINRLNFVAALGMFLLYSVLTGITLSSIFLLYDIYSIYTVFGITAGMFACMSLYGYFTKTDLTSLGNICFMLLVGMVLSFLVNMFLKNGTFDYILSIGGVIIFTLLTAYDSQKIKNLGLMSEAQGQSDVQAKASILGALTLYLDFINLFLLLLRVMGKRRD